MVLIIELECLDIIFDKIIIHPKDLYLGKKDGSEVDECFVKIDHSKRVGKGPQINYHMLIL